LKWSQKVLALSKKTAKVRLIMKRAPQLEKESDAFYRAQAEYYLAEINKILKRLADERIRSNRRDNSASDPNIVAKIKSILWG
jgi:hypothetical protein